MFLFGSLSAFVTWVLGGWAALAAALAVVRRVWLTAGGVARTGADGLAWLLAHPLLLAALVLSAAPVAWSFGDASSAALAAFGGGAVGYYGWWLPRKSAG